MHICLTRILLAPSTCRVVSPSLYTMAKINVFRLPTSDGEDSGLGSHCVPLSWKALLSCLEEFMTKLPKFLPAQHQYRDAQASSVELTAMKVGANYIVHRISVCDRLPDIGSNCGIESVESVKRVARGDTHSNSRDRGRSHPCETFLAQEASDKLEGLTA